jgi:8-amino-7-oxononanoate synthase
LRSALPEVFPESRPGTAIQPVLLGESPRALAASKALESKGFLVTAIRPPTVPAGTARLRVTLSAAHEEAQVDGLIGALREALNA